MVGNNFFVAIGISTGGPATLETLFGTVPKNFSCPILVVQHMPEKFTRLLAERLDAYSEINVREAADMDVPLPGNAYIAPGDSHLVLMREITGYRLRLLKTERVSGHRPSVDVLFKSVARAAGRRSVAVIMTGMGNDGVDGIECVHNAGGFTIAQDKSSSVIYGMNRVAVDMNIVDAVVPLDEITKKILEYISV